MAAVFGFFVKIRTISKFSTGTGGGGGGGITPDIPVALKGPAGTVSMQNIIGGDVPFGYYPEQLSGQDLVYYGPYTALYGSAFQ
jgi:hypothetical protein